MPRSEAQVVSLNTSVFPWQRAMIEQIARDSGALGLSEALRDVLTEYRELKALHYSSLATTAKYVEAMTEADA